MQNDHPLTTHVSAGPGTTFLPIQIKNDAIFVDGQTVKALGESLSESYRSADPFPSIVIDNFLPPEILVRCLEDFPKDIVTEQRRSQELYKGLYHPDDLGACFSRSLFYALNAKPFIEFLEALTGIDGLMADPYYLGGGFHETTRGGKLAIHADFNLHKKLRLLRRVNVLIYLNQNWQEQYGGALELWTTDMKEKRKEIFPFFNRCAIFSTNDDSFHGHPDPLQSPLGVSRKSIALYYYTASESIFAEEKLRTTNFRVRPESTDKIDFFIQFKYFIRDLIPPLFTRLILRLVKGKKSG
jgi:hypothetical protein